MNLKKENEKLREILRDVRPVICNAGYYSLAARIDSALSHQHGNEVASPAQDEREAYSVWCDSNVQKGRTDTNGYHAFKAGAAWQRTRPAQKVNIDTSEQQPVATVKYGGYTTGNQLVWGRGAGLQFLPEGTALYASVIPHLVAVAYLDIGVGGYMDLGTDLSEESLKALPWGRHMLAIIGTYGADGYVSAIQRGK